MFIAIILAIIVFSIAGVWRTFSKAGQHGWAVIVPIYNMIVMARIANKSGWWALLMCIPYLGWIFQIIVYSHIARKFGKSDGFGLGLTFLPFIFFPILGFGKSVYGEQTRIEALNDVFV